MSVSPKGELVWNNILAGGRQNWYPKMAVSSQGTVLLAFGSQGMSSGSMFRCNTKSLRQKRDRLSYAYQVVIVRMDQKGVCHWGRVVGVPYGNPRMYPTDVALDEKGNGYVIGTFGGQAFFDATTLKSPVGQTSLFLTKISDKGSFVWAKQLSSSYPVTLPTSLKLDKQGNMYVIANFDKELQLGTLKITPRRKPGSNPVKFLRDVLVAKYDPTGKLLWHVQIGGNEIDSYSDAIVGPKGSLFVSGNVRGTAQLSSMTYTSKGDADGFVVRLAPKDGKVTWAAFSQGSGVESIGGLSFDSKGSLYVESISLSQSTKHGHLTTPGLLGLRNTRFWILKP